MTKLKTQLDDLDFYTESLFKGLLNYYSLDLKTIIPSRLSNPDPDEKEESLSRIDLQTAFFSYGSIAVLYGLSRDVKAAELSSFVYGLLMEELWPDNYDQKHQWFKNALVANQKGLRVPVCSIVDLDRVVIDVQYSGLRDLLVETLTEEKPGQKIFSALRSCLYSQFGLWALGIDSRPATYCHKSEVSNTESWKLKMTFDKDILYLEEIQPDDSHL